MSMVTSNWRTTIAPFERPDNRRAMWQLINSFVPYAGLWVLMSLVMELSIWLTLLLAPLAAAFLVRLFIIQHDCGHGSFLSSRRANDAIGTVIGVLSIVPYQYWRHTHAIHHASSGNLDRRGTGDVWTLTVKEYTDASWFKRLRYRVYRNPLVLFGIGPFYLFFVHYRFADPDHGRKWQWSVQRHNLLILAAAMTLILLLGWRAYLLIQIPVMLWTALFGVWLFYVQHQFEGVRWTHRGDWSYEDAALHGSSFYKLPRILQWFSGNIGFHHVHHLSPRVPNYHLDRCHRSVPLLQKVRAISLWSGFRSIALRLWDEDKQKLVRIGNAWW